MPTASSSALAAIIAVASVLVPPIRAANENGPWIPATLQIGFDANLSAEAGADDGIALYYAIGRLEDRILKPSLWQEEKFWPHLAGFGYRLSRSVLLDDPLAAWLTTAQHEVFGHGYRGRDNGYRDIWYELPLPRPYGPGGGVTHMEFPRDSLQPFDRVVATTLAGVEAQGVQSERQKLYWTQAGSMDTRGARLYLDGDLALFSYLSASDESELRKPDPDYSNDMLSYILFLNDKEDTRPVEDWRLHLKKIKGRAAVMAGIDPFFWYSAWAVIAKEDWQGRAFFRYPTVPLGPVRMLPSFGYGLGPWGPEYRFEGLFAWGERALSLGYRVGDDTFRNSFGWDATSLGLVRLHGCILDADIHYWIQPTLLIESSDAKQGPSERRPGFSGALNAMSPIFPGRFPIRATAGAGWKSAGFVPGKDLREGAYWRIGLAWTPAAPTLTAAD